VCNNTFPFPFALPLPFPLPFHLPILGSHLFRGPFLTALGVLLIIAVVIVIAMVMMASSFARCCGIHPIQMIIILVNYLIQIQRASQDVSWHTQQASWWLNLCPDIISTVLREMLTGEYNQPEAG
jgi:hypothetical protein